MDACIRSFNQNQLIGISCISYWQSTILDTSRISNTNTGAYAFLLKSDGNPINKQFVSSFAEIDYDFISITNRVSKVKVYLSRKMQKKKAKHDFSANT